MIEGTAQRATPPAIIGFAGQVGSWMLYQYWRISVNYVDVAIGYTMLAGFILIGLLALAAWTYSLYHLAEGKGQNTWYAALSPLGFIGYGILLALPDLNAPRKHYLKSQSYRPPKKAYQRR